jgi:hypothetical protein
VNRVRLGSPVRGSWVALVPELPLQPPALGEIADDGAQRLLALIEDHGHTDLDLHERSVLAPVAALAGESAPVAEILPQARFHLPPVVGDDLVDGHAERLFRGVSEHLAQGSVGLQYPVRIRVEEEDALHGLLDHGPVARLALPQGLLRPTAVANVAAYAHEPLYLAAKFCWSPENSTSSLAGERPRPVSDSGGTSTPNISQKRGLASITRPSSSSTRMPAGKFSTSAR